MATESLPGHTLRPSFRELQGHQGGPSRERPSPQTAKRGGAEPAAEEGAQGGPRHHAGSWGRGTGSFPAVLQKGSGNTHSPIHPSIIHPSVHPFCIPEPHSKTATNWELMQPAANVSQGPRAPGRTTCQPGLQCPAPCGHTHTHTHSPRLQDDSATGDRTGMVCPSQGHHVLTDTCH